MRTLNRVRIALVCLSMFVPGLAVSQHLDEVVTERVLGSQWRQFSRRAGMIFAGTVVKVAFEAVTSEVSATKRPWSPTNPPFVD